MEVDCGFKYLKKRDGVAVYICQVDSVSITQPNTKIESFKGQHETDEDNDGVEQLYFNYNEGNIVEFFPKGLLNNFSHLTSVNIIRCGLKSICREDLRDFRNLEKFYAMYNDLKSLPSNLFLDKPKLKRISFYDNELEFISSQLLEPIIKNGLTVVDLEGNTKISAGYSSNPESGYPIDNNLSLKQLMELIDTQCTKPPEEVSGFKDEAHKDETNNKVAELWISGRYSDFTIVVKNSKDFRVHKNVLGSHSTIFAAMFEDDLEENKTGSMKIFDFSASAVEQFIGFLYTGSVPDDVNAMELSAIAEKYDIPNLKMLSEKTILKNLSHENALEVFNLAYLYSSDDMMDKAFESIRGIFPGKSLSENLRNNPQAIKKLIDAAKNCDEEYRASKDVMDAASRDYQVKINQTQNSFEKLWKSVNENA